MLRCSLKCSHFPSNDKCPHTQTTHCEIDPKEANKNKVHVPPSNTCSEIKVQISNLQENLQFAECFLCSLRMSDTTQGSPIWVVISCLNLVWFPFVYFEVVDHLRLCCYLG